MVDYYGNRRYAYDSSEYPGYDSSWVLGHERDVSFYQDDYYRAPNYASYQYYPRSQSGYYPHTHNDYPGRAQLAWATEIPTRVRMTICCEGCRMKLDKALRDMHGVHDVGISGWANGMVTVTGTASPHKILKAARKFSKSAELWEDPYEHSSRYSHSRY